VVVAMHSDFLLPLPVGERVGVRGRRRTCHCEEAKPTKQSSFLAEFPWIASLRSQ
jgi:hypothetical protein